MKFFSMYESSSFRNSIICFRVGRCPVGWSHSPEAETPGRSPIPLPLLSLRKAALPAAVLITWLMDRESSSGLEAIPQEPFLQHLAETPLSVLRLFPMRVPSTMAMFVERFSWTLSSV